MKKFCLLLAGLLLGCGRSPLNYHLLAPPPPTPSASARAGVYALRQIQLPEYLREEALIARGSGSAIVKFPQERWLETLDTALPTALQRQLEGAARPATVYRYPLAPNVKPEAVLDVDLEEFIADLPAGVVHLRASWALGRGEETNPPRRHFQRDFPLADRQPASLIAAQGEALRALAAAIVATF